MFNCKCLTQVNSIFEYLLTVVATTNTTMAGTGAENIFGYEPSMPMAWIGGIVFSLTALIHIYQYFKHRAWYFYLMMLGILMEVFGFWTRVVVIKNPNNNAAISMTFLLTTSVPSFIPIYDSANSNPTGLRRHFLLQDAI